MAEERRLAMRSTATNPQTGESETWEHVTGNSTPVSKTLREVTVTAPAPVNDNGAAPAVEATPEERARWRAEVENRPLEPLERPMTERLADRIEEAPMSREEIMRRRAELQRQRGALERYGDDYQNIWQRGGYRNAEERREQRMQEAIARERMRMEMERQSKADRNAIMRIDRTKRKNDVGL